MQLQLEFEPQIDPAYPDKLASILTEDLDFHDKNSGYASHNFHSFPAKFPPQLPRAFVLELTEPGDVVLDPMMGSGTTVLESFMAGRQSIGLDIDPLALLVARVKTTPIDLESAAHIGASVAAQAAARVQNEPEVLEVGLSTRWDSSTKEFVDYWFSHKVQLELIALVTEIEQVEDETIRDFLLLAISSIIITKSGGVSLAFDLAHTRPHKAKKVFDIDGEIVVGQELADDTSSRTAILTKKLRSPISEFAKRVAKNLEGAQGSFSGSAPSIIQHANAQDMPLGDCTVDLIVTSPPYASNAIDYMRAHKFSLVWMGYSVDELSEKRREYIGGEYTANMKVEPLPPATSAILDAVSGKDRKKGQVVALYYYEMKRVLAEMYRVLKPGRAAILVVGNSILKGTDIEIHNCLAEIGTSLGFAVPKIGIRNLDRNRRMLPAGMSINHDSQIQQRMHQEYVIGFLKP